MQKLYVGNLSHDVDEQTVHEVFQKHFGPVEEVKLIVNRSSETNYGFVKMVRAEDSDKAVAAKALPYNWTVYKSNDSLKEKKTRDPREHRPEYRDRDYNRERSRSRSRRRNRSSRPEGHSPIDQEMHYRKQRDPRSSQPSRASHHHPRSTYPSYSSPRQHSQTRHTPPSRQNPSGHYQRRHDEKREEGDDILQKLLQQENTNDIDQIAKLLAMDTTQLDRISSSINNEIIEIANNIVVREVFIGNLLCSEAELNKVMSQYGEVEFIEYFQKTQNNFAFIKFKLAEQALGVFEAYQDVAAKLNSPQLRIQFSDHLRRMNIVGNSYNHSGPEKSSDHTSIIYLGYNQSMTVPHEKALRDELGNYVDVKFVYFKKAPDQTQLRNFILVQLADEDQARRVFRKYVKEKKGERKIRLGDKRVELTILLKPKPGYNYQQNTYNAKQNTLTPGKPFGQFPFQPDYTKFPHGKPPSPKKYMTHPTLNVQVPDIRYLGMQMKPKESEPSQPKDDNILDMLSNILKNDPPERVIVVEEQPKEDIHPFWSGFITRFKQQRVGVDARLLYGEEISLNDYNLNIAQDLPPEEVLNKKPMCMAIFSPSNTTQNLQFTDYVRFLTNGSPKAGVIQLVTNKNNVLYLLPACPEVESSLSIKLEELQILGVFCKLSAGAKDKEWLDAYQNHLQQGKKTEPDQQTEQPQEEHPPEQTIDHQGISTFDNVDMEELFNNPELFDILKNY